MGRDEIAKRNSRILQEAVEARMGRPEMWPLDIDKLPLLRDENGQRRLAPLFTVPPESAVKMQRTAATPFGVEATLTEVNSMYRDSQTLKLAAEINEFVRGKTDCDIVAPVALEAARVTFSRFRLGTAETHPGAPVRPDTAAAASAA